jgi:hypothetical protein
MVSGDRADPLHPPITLVFFTEQKKYGTEKEINKKRRKGLAKRVIPRWVVHANVRTVSQKVTWFLKPSVFSMYHDSSSLEYTHNAGYAGAAV